MYRDDVCAVCGESLPPDHLYCREHAATVDDRLHEVGALVPRLADDIGRLASLLRQVAPETWEWLADRAGVEDPWPPAPALLLRADPEDVDIEADEEPGYVRVRLTADLSAVLGAVAEALGSRPARALSAAAREAEGANATH